MSEIERIEIEQDCEIDYDGEVGGHLHVYWSEGHGHDDGAFVRAVLDYCLHTERGIPAIDSDDIIAEVWQYDRPTGDSVEYDRRPEIPSGARRKDWRPVTVLDLDRRRNGATKCSVDGCTRPWHSGQPVQIVTEIDGAHRALTMWLCRRHQAEMPEPSYRLRFVPVGATIVLPPAVVS